MKMKKISEHNITDLEQSSRIYRYISATVKILDDGLQKSQSIVDLFSPNFVTQRCRLKEYCEKLIFLNSAVHSRKAEELLWRKGYYDVINFAKQFKKTNDWAPRYQAVTQNHILSGIGYYHHLVLRLQSEFHLDLGGKVDCALTSNVHCGQLVQECLREEGAVIWAEQACQRCLICLGDLARYLIEFGGASQEAGPAKEVGSQWSEAPRWAKRYYCQALMMNPNIGLPHNQMGTMAGGRNKGLDAVYHYMRCLMCEQPFEGAEANLKRILERSEKHYENCLEDMRVARALTPQDDIQRFLLSFLNLVNMFYCHSDSSCEVIPNLCQRTLMDFRTSLSYTDHEENDSTSGDQVPARSLSEENIYHILVISIMCVWRLHNKAPGSPHTSLTIAFTLAYVSYLIQYTVESLEESLSRYGIIAKEEDDNASPSNGKADPDTQDPVNGEEIKVEDAPVDESDAGKKRKNRKWEKLRRRKRNISSSDDSVQSEGNMSDTDDDLSDNKSVASDASDLNTRDFTAFNSDSDDNAIDSMSQENDATKKGGDSYFHKGLEGNRLQNSSSVDMNVTRSLEHISILSEMRSLVVIRVACHWLRCNTDVISACGPSSRTLWARFVSLLNLIQVDWNVLKIDGLHSEVIKILNEDLTPAERAVHSDPEALSEDVELHGLPPFDSVYQKRAWDLISSQWLSEREEAILRIFSLQNFGHYLTTLPDTEIIYNQDKKKFELGIAKPSTVTILNGGAKVTETKEEDAQTDTEHGRKQLMRSMAHLWLKSEVRDLEKQVKRNINMNFVSPYVIADTTIFTEHSQLLKKLLDNRAFILIVPSIVISQLDGLKNHHLGAREAIRWLESQFRRGSRYIRAQRNHERATLARLKYPKRKDRDAWTFFQILECCNYFCQQGGNNDGDGKLVTLLTGEDLSDTSGVTNNAEFSAKGLTSSAGVNYEHISTFHKRWAQKSPG